MASSKDRTLEILRAQASARRTNKLDFFKPYPKQKEFCDATADHTEIALVAGNQVGKSEVGAYMASVFLTGKYPDGWQGRRFDGPTQGWACGESAVAVRDVSQSKLCGPAGDESQFGHGMIPKADIVGKILSHGAGGGLDKIMVRHVSGGTSSLSFKSYDQAREKWQGATLDFVWLDEECDTEHYFEAIARIAATEGLIYSTFTPLSGFLRLLPRFYREEDPKAAARRCVIRMALEDADHFKDPAKREALLGNYPAHQRRTRAEGRPMMGSGAVFEPVDADDLAEDIYLFDGEITNSTSAPQFFQAWALLWALDFGIDHAFAAVLLAHDRDHDIIHVLSEIKIRGGIPIVHAAAMKKIAPNVPVAWPHDGNARDKGSGRTLAAIYRGEGLKMMGEHATFREGGYSFEGGLMAMQTRMQSGKFKVSKACRQWFDEFSTYHRKEGIVQKLNDDLLSASRIGLMQIRSAQIVALDPAYRGWAGEDRKSRRGQIARGVDFDPFTGE